MLRHLNTLPNGILAFHISNDALDLRPVIAKLAEQRHMSAWLAQASPPYRSIWVIVSALDRNGPVPGGEHMTRITPNPRFPLWTDDYSQSVAGIAAVQTNGPKHPIEPIGENVKERGITKGVIGPAMQFAPGIAIVVLLFPLCRLGHIYPTFPISSSIFLLTWFHWLCHLFRDLLYQAAIPGAWAALRPQLATLSLFSTTGSVGFINLWMADIHFLHGCARVLLPGGQLEADYRDRGCVVISGGWDSYYHRVPSGNCEVSWL